MNKTTLIEKMAELVGGKRITDVSDIRDESDRTGMRIVIEVKRDGSPHTVMQQLFKHTALQTQLQRRTCSPSSTASRRRSASSGCSSTTSRTGAIVIRRRTQFDLARAQERAHILEGLKIALDNLDEVIKTIRASADVDAARAALVSRFKLSEAQANAILEMQLRRLAALERKKIEDEYEQVIRLIADLEDLLANPRKILSASRTTMTEVIREVREQPQDADPLRCRIAS